MAKNLQNLSHLPLEIYDHKHVPFYEYHLNFFVDDRARFSVCSLETHNSCTYEHPGVTCLSG